MPWHEMSPMEQRLEFFVSTQTGLLTMTELAAQYGISRKTGYKWLERYEADGARVARSVATAACKSPRDRSGRWSTRSSPLRRRQPRWGATKLLTVAARRQPEATGRADRPCARC